LNYEQLAGTGSPGTSIGVSPELYYGVNAARLAAGDVDVQASIVGRPAPVLGRLLTRLRRRVHNLAVYYVNLHAARDVVFNRTAAEVLVLMADELGRSLDQIATLRAEVATLKEQIAAQQQVETARR
jgi:hypothetical protein